MVEIIGEMVENFGVKETRIDDGETLGDAEDLSPGSVFGKSTLTFTTTEEDEELSCDSPKLFL